jgi:hypothetical protein
VSDVTPGKETKVFARSDVAPNVCFSVHAQDRTLDLECENTEMRYVIHMTPIACEPAPFFSFSGFAFGFFFFCIVFFTDVGEALEVANLLPLSLSLPPSYPHHTCALEVF